MRLIALDLETHAIQPGLLAPPIVCGSTAEWGGASGLHSKHDTLKIAKELLLDQDVLITGANIAFDFGCLCAADPEFIPAIFKAYEDERVYDVLIGQALDAIANGHLFKEPNGQPLLNASGKQTDRYSLDICVRLCLGRADAKEHDFWRVRYAVLERVPMHLWPEDARLYPVDDAKNTVEVAAYQLGVGRDECFKNLQDLPRQVETDWGLHLGAMWGLRTDESRCDLLKARAEVMHKEYFERFQKRGFFRSPREKYVAAGKKDPEAGKKDTCAVARAVAEAYGATGVCITCGGDGRFRRAKRVPCRGPKVKNKFAGCLYAVLDPELGRRVELDDPEKYPLCPVCGTSGEIPTFGGEVICDTCSGTGFGDVTMVPPTDSGKISTSRDTLSESGNDELDEFGENKHEKILRTYEPYLRQGVEVPITLDPHVLVESGRTSYSGPIQLFPRGSMSMGEDGQWVPTSRECFVARPGRVFGSSDYPAGELCTLAQVCLWVVGESRMAEIINETKDPGSLHTVFAAAMIGESVESLKARVKAGDKQAKGYRQAAKPFSFGVPGGMGAAKIVITNRKEGAGMTEAPSGRKYAGIRFCILVGGAHECGTQKLREWKNREITPTCKECLELAEYQLKPLFLDTYPEVKEYHKWVADEIESCDGLIPCFGPWRVTENAIPHRMRSFYNSNNPFTSASNNGFQALLADVTKTALRKAAREAYTNPDSVLYKGRARFPGFFHDELFSEIDEEWAHLAGPRVGELMLEAYREWVPDVHIEGVDTALMKFWTKDAESVFGVDCAPRADLAPVLIAAGWRGDKPKLTDDERLTKARAALAKGHVEFDSISKAKKFTEQFRVTGAQATDPRLVVWTPK